jgi:hypothetical protein
MHVFPGLDYFDLKKLVDEGKAKCVYFSNGFPNTYAVPASIALPVLKKAPDSSFFCRQYHLDRIQNCSPEQIL